MLFKRPEDLPAESAQHKSKRMELLNEYLSDQTFERLQQLLFKQYIEKEQLLKNCLQKYSDNMLSEISAVKSNFKLDYDRLESIKDKLTEDDYKTQLKQLRLWEENQIRHIRLQTEKAHKEEESSLRKELEKKHNAEQIEQKTRVMENQAILRKACIDDEVIANLDRADEEKALDNFKQFKRID